MNLVLNVTDKNYLCRYYKYGIGKSVKSLISYGVLSFNSSSDESGIPCERKGLGRQTASRRLANLHTKQNENYQILKFSTAYTTVVALFCTIK